MKLLKIFGFILGGLVILVVVFFIDVIIARNLNTRLHEGLDQINIGDSSKEVIEKMSVYRKSPNGIYENDTIWYKQNKIVVTTYLYRTYWSAASSDLHFYFPPAQDSLMHIYYD